MPVTRELVGRPLTRRRYNVLFERFQAERPWPKRLGVSTRWLRHTAGTAMERAGGFAVAAEFIGHEHGYTPRSPPPEPSRPKSATRSAFAPVDNIPSRPPASSNDEED